MSFLVRRSTEHIQSNLSYVTFQGNSEIWSHKTGGRLIQVSLIKKIKCSVKGNKNKVTLYKLFLNRGGH
jgi:hypothetical protein